MRITASAIGISLFSLVAVIAPRAFAQDAIAQFYKDKTVTIVIGSTAGGGVDVYGRLVARHLGRHIPGNPKVVPQNMPGAGSIAAASHIYTIAPKDGTQIGTVLSGAIFDPLVVVRRAALRADALQLHRQRQLGDRRVPRARRRAGENLRRYFQDRGDRRRHGAGQRVDGEPGFPAQLL